MNLPILYVSTMGWGASDAGGNAYAFHASAGSNDHGSAWATDCGSRRRAVASDAGRRVAEEASLATSASGAYAASKRRDFGR